MKETVKEVVNFGLIIRKIQFNNIIHLMTNLFNFIMQYSSLPNQLHACKFMNKTLIMFFFFYFKVFNFY